MLWFPPVQHQILSEENSSNTSVQVPSGLLCVMYIYLSHTPMQYFHVKMFSVILFSEIGLLFVA